MVGLTLSDIKDVRNSFKNKIHDLLKIITQVRENFVEKITYVIKKLST